MPQHHREVHIAHWVGKARAANRYALRAMREGIPGVAEMYRQDIAEYMAKARAI